ncbi:hypothetical protein L6452_30449 [Arctium lappa]|uniref:Uncharacterized protein n=3 Tax=Arctium lappa TaxID=4217 RepID=A0ACB8ZIS5_ARCLA|nr:hypothetical protein L6452_45218 [Arctium lappa]KAI3697427.1 hypothetical protein L6452_30437 [Arctium lappa]KAI3697432.1 hypothetical protein L6452_30443 [Arctium lappa]KAI3697437.1 hypothetical protein L6452_30449 [Arctium lappa]
MIVFLVSIDFGTIVVCHTLRILSVHILIRSGSMCRYKLMLKKAVEDDVVVDHTNLYNQFFVSSGQGNTKRILKAMGQDKLDVAMKDVLVREIPRES